VSPSRGCKPAPEVSGKGVRDTNGEEREIERALGKVRGAGAPSVPATMLSRDKDGVTEREPSAEVTDGGTKETSRWGTLDPCDESPRCMFTPMDAHGAGRPAALGSETGTPSLVALSSTGASPSAEDGGAVTWLVLNAPQSAGGSPLGFL